MRRDDGVVDRIRRLGTWWRSYVDAHATRGVLLRWIAQLPPSALRPMAVHKSPPLAPSRRMRASVIIPCHNYGRFLPEAVGSALSQKGVDVEVIIVDDVSTDDSLAVARRLALENPGVSVVANDENIGHVRSFNAGFAQATGELIVKLDADDLLAPGSLGRAAAVFEREPEVGLVYGHPRHFEHPDVPSGSVGNVRWTIWHGHDWLAERCKHGTSVITTPEMALRASLLREFGALDPALRYTPDLGISLRIAAVSDVAHVDNADQAFHREHAASMSVNEGSGDVVDLEARRDAFERVFSQLGHRIVEADRLLHDVRRALARDARRDVSSLLDSGATPPETQDLVEFARAIWPGGRSALEKLTARGHRSLRGPFGRVATLARRAARRVRNESYYARWAVRGF